MFSVEVSRRGVGDALEMDGAAVSACTPLTPLKYFSGRKPDMSGLLVPVDDMEYDLI